MKNNESEEMYLETIFLLKKANKEIRSIDIANELNYSRASVSRAINLLLNKEYITITNGLISFTEKGLNKAQSIYERHDIITKVLIKIGVDERVAEENACRIEHVISDEVIIASKFFLNNK